MLLRFGLLIVCFLAATTSRAQGLFDPKPDPPTADVADPAAEESSEILDDPDPLVDQLTERAARGGLQLAGALSAFAKIGRWDKVNEWLGRVDSIGDSGQLSAMAKVMGPDTLLRISMRTELGEKEKSAIKKLSAAAKATAQSQPKIDAAIAQLGSNDIDQRLAAIRTLIRGDEASVVSLAKEIANPAAESTRDQMLQLMLKIDDRSIDAIRQLALYGNPAVRSTALDAMVRVDPARSIPDCASALYAVNATPEERNIATAGLAAAGVTSTRESALKFLLNDLASLRREARQVANGAQQTTIWHITDDRVSVTDQRVRQVIAAYRNVYDAAARVRRIGILTPPVMREVLNADLAYRVMIDRDWGDEQQVRSIVSRYSILRDVTGLNEALAYALDQDDDLATLGLVRIAGSEAIAEGGFELLQGSATKLAPLVQAVRHPIAQVRYDAAKVIASLRPSAPYSGSSYVKKCWAEMSRLGDRPLAALVETRSEVILQEELILSQMGFDSVVVGTVRDLERAIARGGDLRLVVSKTNTVDLPPVELIDRVRRQPNGQRLPIVFYGQPFAGLRTGRWVGDTVLLDLPATPSAFAELRQQLELRQRIPELTVLDRRLYRKVGADALRLATD